jgi:hypothetical protein
VARREGTRRCLGNDQPACVFVTPEEKKKKSKN